MATSGARKKNPTPQKFHLQRGGLKSTTVSFVDQLPTTKGQFLTMQHCLVVCQCPFANTYQSQVVLFPDILNTYENNQSKHLPKSSSLVVPRYIKYLQRIIRWGSKKKNTRFRVLGGGELEKNYTRGTKGLRSVLWVPAEGVVI